MEDNGTFACEAENQVFGFLLGRDLVVFSRFSFFQAGRAVATFTLHVVVPMPPKPPQVRGAPQPH